ncbi:MAG: hypothetical protein K5773_02255 [Pseudobutyrivibrio sp.]|nr:hypothetical protein [Pseudobutyrivibrio sp.]
MTFNSHVFILMFLPASLAGYFLLCKDKDDRVRKIFLLLVSYIFIFWGFDYAGLITIVVSSLINYLFYRAIPGNNKSASSKAIMALALVLNILAIFIFKYLNSTLAGISSLTGADFTAINIIFPVGFSFYAFQQMGLIIDTYRGEYQEDISLTDYLLFVSFFPRVLSGPIVTPQEFFPQLQDMDRKKFNWDNVAKGLYRFAIGLGKKVLIADYLAIMAAEVFDHVFDYQGIQAFIGALAFSLQLYFDFSGYTDMAIGIGHMFNFDLPENFDSPYKSTNIKEFWNRWHMTLTRFLTKYVYFTLGGSRNGKVRAYINIIIVFLISGLWHGSKDMMPFIAWGLYVGIAMVIYRMTARWYDKLPKPLAWLINTLVIIFSWIPFRASDLMVARILTKNIFMPGPLPSLSWDLCILIFAMILAFVPKNARQVTEDFDPSLSRAVFGALLIVLSLISSTGVGTFIYAGF